MAMKMDGPLLPLSEGQPERCSVAGAMDVLGTKSAMLVLREAFYGTRRFDDFVRRVGVTEAVIPARLQSLVGVGVLGRQPCRESPLRTRNEYVLTERGKAPLSTVVALTHSGDTDLQNYDGPAKVVDDRICVRVQPRTDEDAEFRLENLLVRVNRQTAGEGVR
jgi:DNA-binding HxlR family transcriptional regulator